MSFASTPTMQVNSLSFQFSPGDRYLIYRDSIFDIQTRQRVYRDNGNSFFSFSPNEQYIIVGENGVFRFPSMEKLFDVDGGWGEFNPDGTGVVVYDDGYYDIDTGEKLFDLASKGAVDIHPNWEYIVNWDRFINLNSAIIDVETAETIMTFTGSRASFTKDGQLLAVDDNGIYNVETWELLVELDGTIRFSPDEHLIFTRFPREGRCVFYGVLATSE